MNNFNLNEEQIKQLIEIQKIIKGNIYQQLSEMSDIYKKTVSQIDVASLSETQKILAVNAIQKVGDHIEQLNRSVDLKKLTNSMDKLLYSVGNYKILYLSKNSSNIEEMAEDEEVNKKIVTEIFKPDNEKEIIVEETPTIIINPVNEKVLKYLTENPKDFYQLTSRQFEVVMAEIYNKLGYKVELTKATRDGGKDLIIRKPEALGDFIYYVECKKYAPKNHVGIGIVKNLVATINTDKVNGGILATTSYFSKDTKKFIEENKYGYQIKMHDFDTIRNLLNETV